MKYFTRDLRLKNLVVDETITVDDLTVDGSLVVDGNTTLGDAAADTVTINAETVSQPNIPCFLVYQANAVINVTGAGALYSLPFDTTVFDQAANVAAGVFTAPATGRYAFYWTCRASDLSAAMTQRNIVLITSNSQYAGSETGVVGVAQQLIGSVIADMDAGDTAFVRLQISNGAANTATFFGSAARPSYFSGVRVA